MEENLLTVAQAAQLKGVTRAAVYAAITQGRLPHQRVLGHIAVREADVRAWIETGSKGGHPAGKPLSAEAKAKISSTQKQRWAKRKRFVFQK